MTDKTLSARPVAAMLRRYPTRMLRDALRDAEHARGETLRRYVTRVRRCAKLELARRGAWGAR